MCVWINHISEPNAEERACVGCDKPCTDSSSNPSKPADQIIQLPCGCRFHRCCIAGALETATPRFGPSARCPFCLHFFFKPFIESWLEKLQPIEKDTLKEEDRCCGICFQAYGGGATSKDPIFDQPSSAERIKGLVEAEHPIKLPNCVHVFGNECIRRWFSPKPQGGNGNTCPACRQIQFRPWPTEGIYDEYERLLPEERDWFTAQDNVHTTFYEELLFWQWQYDTQNRQGNQDAARICLDRIKRCPKVILDGLRTR